MKSTSNTYQMKYTKLKDYEGFRPGMIVYLKTDFRKTLPMVIQEIHEIESADNRSADFSFTAFDGLKNKHCDESPSKQVSIVCQHQTSQRTIATKILSPDVITRKPEKDAD